MAKKDKKETDKKKDPGHKKGDHMSKDVLPKGETGIVIIRSGVEKRLDDIGDEPEV